MKIAHLSDTHLGYAGVGVQRYVEDPYRPGISIRQQEADIMDGFREAIDRILERVQPDLVIHSGDLFDHAHPTPHAIDFAMRQLRRLGDVGIPLVVVEGDHSSPRIPGQGQVLRLLLHLPLVHVACGNYTPVRIANLVIHGLPHRAVAQGYNIDTSTLASDCAHILLTHGVAEGYPYYNTTRLAASLPVRDQAEHFAYIALGHYHRFSQVKDTDRAFYAGATALVAQSDFHPGYSFGFNVVELGAKSPKVRRELLTTRPMHAYGLHDACNLSARDILTYIQRQVEAVSPQQAYCQVIIDRIDPPARRELSLHELSSLFEGHSALYIQCRVRELTVDEVDRSVESTSPMARFQRLAQAQQGDSKFNEAVRDLGISILSEAQTLLNAEDVQGGE